MKKGSVGRAQTAPASSVPVAEITALTSPPILVEEVRVPLAPIKENNLSARTAAKNNKQSKRSKRDALAEEAIKDRETALKRFEKRHKANFGQSFLFIIIFFFHFFNQHQDEGHPADTFSNGESFSTVTPLRAAPAPTTLPRRSNRIISATSKKKEQEKEPSNQQGMFSLGVRAKQYAAATPKKSKKAGRATKHNAFSEDQFFDLPQIQAPDAAELLDEVGDAVKQRRKRIASLERCKLVSSTNLSFFPSFFLFFFFWLTIQQ